MSKATLLALTVAAAAVAGSLWLSLGMGLSACPLCYYQRTFAMAIVGVLTVGLFSGVRPTVALSLVCLPLAVGGWGVAAFHVSLEFRGILECPRGVFGAGSAPQQSFAVYTLLLLVLFFDLVFNLFRSAGWSWVLRGLGAIVLGGLFVLGSISSNPPPLEPKQAYDKPPETCRRPYKTP